MRDGVAAVFAKRLTEADIEYLPNTFNPYKEQSFGLMIDAKNFYGGIMKTFPIPLVDFVSDSTTNLQKILEPTDDSRWGFIVGCDL